MNFKSIMQDKSVRTVRLDLIVGIICIWCLGISKIPAYVAFTYLNIPLFITFLCLAFGISFLINKTRNLFISFNYNFFGILVSFTTFLISLISVRNIISTPLADDGLVHYQKSLLGYRTLDIIIDKTNLFNLESTPIIWLISIFNFIILSSILGLIFLTLKKFNSQTTKISYIGIYTFLILWIYHFMGLQILDLHPALSRFPIWLSQVFFGISSTSARLPGLIFYSFSAGLLANAIYDDRNIYEKKISTKIIIFLFLISGAYIPLNIITASIIEPSIWATSAWLIACSYLIISKKNIDNKFIKSCYLVITILSLMRYTAILVLPILLIKSFLNKNIKNIRDILFFIVVPIPALVQILFTVVVGNGSFKELGEGEKIINFVSLKKYFYFFFSSIGESSIFIFSIFLLVILVLIITQKDIKFRHLISEEYLILVAFLWSPIIFILTNQVNYALPRYFAEYLGGGISILSMLLSVDLINNLNAKNIFFSLIPFSIISLNSNIINNAGSDHNYLIRNQHFYTKRFDYPPAYPITRALKFMLHSRVNENFATLSQQNIYNNMYYIHSGASKSEINKINKNQNILKELLNSGKNSSEIINDLLNKEIFYILLTKGNFNERRLSQIHKDLINEIEAKGKPINTFNLDNGSSLTIYKLKTFR